MRGPTQIERIMSEKVDDWVSLNRSFQNRTFRERKINHTRVLTKGLMVLLSPTSPYTVKSAILTFVSENASFLFAPKENLVKFMRAAEHLLKQSVDVSRPMQLIQGQVLVTWTSVLIEIDAISRQRKLFEGFVALLCRILYNTTKSDPGFHNLRLMACSSLRELELTYPCLLESLLGDLVILEDESMDMSMSTVSSSTSKSRSTRSRISCPLLDVAKRDCSHAGQAYVCLLLTVLEHVAVRMSSVLDEGEHFEHDDGVDDVIRNTLLECMTERDCNEENNLSKTQDFKTPLMLKSSSLRATPPSSNSSIGGFCVSPIVDSLLRTPQNRVHRFFHHHHHHDLRQNRSNILSTPLPPSIRTRVIPALSVAFESLSLMSIWQRVTVIEKLTTLISLLNLNSGVVQHHIMPLLQSRSPILCHAILLMHKARPTLLTETNEREIVKRICHLIRDHTALLQTRILAVRWIMNFPSSSPKRSFALLHEHFKDLYPEIGDPLDLRAAKLRALLKCFRPDEAPPEILRALDCVREWPYHDAESRFSSVADEFLLGVLRRFPTKLAPNITRLLVRVTCTWPHLVPNVVKFVDTYESGGGNESILIFMLDSLSRVLPSLSPPRRLSQYFTLMERIGRASKVNPIPLLKALMRLVQKGENICSIGSWGLGSRVLDVCRTSLSLNSIMYYAHIHTHTRHNHGISSTLYHTKESWNTVELCVGEF